MPSEAVQVRGRVVMLIENLSFPFDRRMRQEAATLRAAGFAVTVVCPRGRGYDQRWYESCDGVRVYRYPQLVEGRQGWSYALEYGWALAWMQVLLLWIAVRHGVDIVHVASPPDLLFVPFLLLGWMGRRLVYDQHDLSPETFADKFGEKSWLYRVLLWLEAQSYRHASLVIAPNQSYYEVARRRGNVPADKLTIVRSGPDLDRFVPVAPQPGLREVFSHLVVYVGVMGTTDGVDRAVRAVAHLVNGGRHDTLFAFLGSGECWQALQQLAAQLGVSRYVRFPGRVSDACLLAYLSSADIGIAADPPTPFNNLCTMNKVLEYMACALPVVAFDVLETQRSAGDAGVYASGDDPAAMASALDALLADPARRAHMGALGRARVENEVGWHHSARHLIAAYNRLQPAPTPSSNWENSAHA
ncbi:MAG: glycosyltransferase family 4 protein [Terriglobales bacterium]